MTQPSSMASPNKAGGAGFTTAAAKPAPPPNPKIQAVDFALQLAVARSTGSMATIASIDDIITWAGAIDDFLSQK